jgi:ABC-type nickel/cobalt efflux system permease component RcnA
MKLVDKIVLIAVFSIFVCVFTLTDILPINMASEFKNYEAGLAVTKDNSSSSDDHHHHHHSGAIEWTAEDERRIRQRMDWRIVPIVLALYLMCFIDR